MVLTKRILDSGHENRSVIFTVPWSAKGWGSKLMVTNVQNATDLRLFAPKLFDLGETLLLKFLKLILVWHSKSLISFLVVNLCLKGFSFEARKKTLFEESSMELWTIWQNVRIYLLTLHTLRFVVMFLLLPQTNLLLKFWT